MRVGYGTHYGAYCEAVEVVIYKDEYTESKGRKLCANSGFDVGLCPSTESGRTTGFVDERYHYTKHYKEQEDSRVSCYRLDESIVYDGVNYLERRIYSVENTACCDTDKQRGVDLFCHERERNRDYRGNERHKGRIVGAVTDRNGLNDTCSCTNLAVCTCSVTLYAVGCFGSLDDECQSYDYRKSKSTDYYFYKCTLFHFLPSKKIKPDELGL